MNNKDISNIKIMQKMLVTSVEYVKINSIYPHENVLKDRLDGMIGYINSLYPYIVLPTILICEETNVIIDGHHRYYALKALNIETAPISRIKYQNNKIMTTIGKNTIKKEKVIESGLKNILLKPKSTSHHIIIFEDLFPIILLSELAIIK